MKCWTVYAPEVPVQMPVEVAVKPPPFAYAAPATVDEAVRLLGENAGAEPRVLAGGQSLIPLMNFRLAKPGYLIDLRNVAGLSGIRRDGDVLVVAWGMPVRPGRLALVRLPEGPHGPRGLSVKRVTGRDPADPERWWVERDNPREGTDSWLVGGIPEADVPAAVLVRLPRAPVRVARALASRARFGAGRLGKDP